MSDTQPPTTLANWAELADGGDLVEFLSKRPPMPAVDRVEYLDGLAVVRYTDGTVTYGFDAAGDRPLQETPERGGAVHLRQGDRPARPRSVDHHPGAGVDPDMAGVGDEIPWQGFCPGDPPPGTALRT